MTVMEPYSRSPRGGAPEGDDPRRCKATSQQSGERCRRWAMENQRVCPFHGGNTPAGKRRAQLSLLDLLPISTRKHKEILETSTDERVVLQAVKMVYDRTGLEEGSASEDMAVVKEMIMSRLFDVTGDLPEGEELPPDDVVDAELVEDDPTLEDLL